MTFLTVFMPLVWCAENGVVQSADLVLQPLIDMRRYVAITKPGTQGITFDQTYGLRCRPEARPGDLTSVSE